MSGQGRGVCNHQARRKGRRNRLSGTAVRHNLCFILQDLVTLISSVLQGAQVFVHSKARQLRRWRQLTLISVVAAIAKVAWKFCVFRASYWQWSVENFSLMEETSPYPKLVTLEYWVDAHAELPLWISPSRKQHGIGSDSTAASKLGFREGRTYLTWKHLGIPSQAIL